MNLSFFDLPLKEFFERLYQEVQDIYPSTAEREQLIRSFYNVSSRFKADENEFKMAVVRVLRYHVKLEAYIMSKPRLERERQAYADECAQVRLTQPHATFFSFESARSGVLKRENERNLQILLTKIKSKEIRDLITYYHNSDDNEE